MKKGLLLLFCLLFMISLASFADEEVSLFSMPAQTPAPVGVEGQPASPEASPEPTQVPMLAADGGTIITISALGDLTFGGDVRKSVNIFERELKKQNGDLGFVTRNIRDLLSADDMTIVNFETTLTNAPVPKNKQGNEFVFSAPAEYIDILTKGSIEAVTFENNHALDHGEKGVQDTLAAFEQAGIVWSREDHLGIFEVHGVKIGMLAYQTFNGQYPRLMDKVPQDVQAARQQCDILIVSYHWGAEKDYAPNNNQIALGRLTIDAGADLVLGHHSHRINPIEYYNGKYIVYSLANFSFAGNNKPSDMSSYAFQIRFNVNQGQATVQGFRIVPFRISSKTDYNDFIPTPYTAQRDIDTVINTLLANSNKKLEYAVTAYPVDWE